MAGDEQLANQIKRLSPVACQHISLLGNFIFSTNSEIVDIKGFVDNMLKNFQDDSNGQKPCTTRAENSNQDEPVLSG